jgi:hypothetical protein
VEFSDAAKLMILDCQSRQLSPHTIRFYEQCVISVVKIIGPKKITAFCSLDIRRVLTTVPPRSAPHHYRALN